MHVTERMVTEADITAPIEQSAQGTGLKIA